MDTETIKTEEIKGIVSGGKFVTVEFIKKDGSKRVLNGRTGVSRYVNGVGLPYDKEEKGIIILYEIAKGENHYRAVRINSIISVTADKKKYVVQN